MRLARGSGRRSIDAGRKTSQSLVRTILLCFAALSIFAVDLTFPPGASIPILYCIVVTVAVSLRRGGAVLAFAAGSSVLTVLGALLGPGPVLPLEIVAVNRVLSLAGLWATAWAGVACIGRPVTVIEILPAPESAPKRSARGPDAPRSIPRTDAIDVSTERSRFEVAWSRGVDLPRSRPRIR